MSKEQRRRKSPTKPSVVKLNHGGMWWAQVIDLDGTYYCGCFFAHANALEKAHEYAVMVKAQWATKNFEGMK
jgi:hypothetical protein